MNFQPFGSFTITPEGFVSGCVLDYHKALIVGDFNKQSLKEIWQSKVYQDLFNIEKLSDLPDAFA